jgi:hypothetical protein
LLLSVAHEGTKNSAGIWLSKAVIEETTELLGTALSCEVSKFYLGRHFE